MRKRVFALLCLLALAGGGAMAAGDMGASSPSVAERLGDARKAMAAKDWRGAAFELDQAVREEPRNPDAHNMLGYYYRKRPNADLAKAFEHYNTALKLDPRHKGAHEYIGEAFLMARKPAEAQKHLAQLAAICGNTSCEEYTDLARAIAAYTAANK